MNEMIYEAETVPRNPVIARAFRLIGWAETAGSGMLKMQKNWQEAGFSAPVIRNNQPRYWFTLELEMKKPAVAGDVLGEKVGDKVGEKVGDRLTENQVNILNLLKNNPQISAKQQRPRVLPKRQWGFVLNGAFRNISNWFKWRGFEDIPPNYLQTG